MLKHKAYGLLRVGSKRKQGSYLRRRYVGRRRLGDQCLAGIGYIRNAYY